MKTKTKDTATLFRDWLNDNYLIEDQARLAKADIRDLFKSVRYYGGDPHKIMAGEAESQEEDTSIKSYVVTATVTVIVDATDERDAMQKADEEFESRDLCCEMPWEAKLEEDRADDEADEFDAIGMKKLWNQC
jgi:hypothetical protein